MIVDPGETLMVVHRRLYEEDSSRFFVGKVEDYQDGIVRVTGYSFARNPSEGNYCRKNEKHTKLYAVSSGTVLTYVLPSGIDLDQIEMSSGEFGLMLVDGGSFSMNISEWIHPKRSG